MTADEFRELSAQELPVAAVFWTGRPFPEADGRSPGLGWAGIAAAVGRVAGVSREELATPRYYALVQLSQFPTLTIQPNTAAARN